MRPEPGWLLLHHPDQVGETAGLHLFPDARPVDLDGALADPELIGDVLVGHAEDEMVEDLLLANGQPGDPFGHDIGRQAWLRPVGERVGGGLDGAQQLRFRARLLDEVDRPPFHRLHRERDVAMRREDDDGYGDAPGGEQLLQLHASQARHAQIDEGAQRRLGLELLDEFLARSKAHRLEAVRRKQRAQRIPGGAIVVDDVDPRAARGTHALRPPSLSRVNRNSRAVRDWLRPYPAAMRLDDRSAQRQSDAHSAGRGIVERLEQRPFDVLRDTHTGIPDRDLYQLLRPAASRSSGRAPSSPAWR